jgi:hypothetical protein
MSAWLAGRARGLRDDWARAVQPGVVWLPAVGWLVLILAADTVNAVSVAADLARAGSHAAGWEPYVWEYSSWLGSVIAFAPVWLGTAWLDRRSGRRGVFIAGLVGLSLVFSGVHIATMLGVRWWVYRLAGGQYHFGQVGARLLYEYRKDAFSFLLLIGIIALWRRYPRVMARDSPAPAAAAPSREPVFLVTDRDATLPVRASQIDWIEAQGNYVALHVAGRTHLLRQPMKQVEATLAGWPFLRTHRSAMVNRDRISRVAGDWVELAPRLPGKEAERAPLSDRRRGLVLKELAEL